jgi:formylglycine-generating enzyme required for sulfatase activity
MNRTVVVVLAVIVFLLTAATMFSLVRDVQRGKRIEQEAKRLRSTQVAPPTIPAGDFGDLETIQGGDGRVMSLVAAGAFTMGGGSEGDFDEQPQRVIYLDAYYVDQYEVTHADYARFSKMLKRPMPVIPVFEDDPRLLTGENQPVVGVRWIDAFDYCKWAGGRLPTEAEWEKAAAGENGRIWPWGDLFDARVANGRGEQDGFLYSAPVGKFEAGRSSYGLYDMSGNVSEWVSDWYDQFYYKKAPFKNPKGPDEPDISKVLVYRGGSFAQTAHDLRAAKRFGGAHPERGENTVGFRCARDFSVS